MLTIRDEQPRSPVQRPSVGRFLGGTVAVAAFIVVVSWSLSERSSAPLDEPITRAQDKPAGGGSKNVARSRTRASRAPLSSPARSVVHPSLPPQSSQGSMVVEDQPATVLAIEPEPEELAPVVAATGFDPPHHPGSLLADVTTTSSRVLSAYLSGQRTSWMSYDVPVHGPLIVRAAGQVSIGTEVAGPNGISVASDRSDTRRANVSPDARVLPSAPYLALIGRLCSERRCSETFPVGSHAVLCPANTVGTTLQLWTNNDVWVDGVRSLKRYSGTLGGFTVSVSAGSATACRASTASSQTAAALGQPGQYLRGPELNVSSSQAWWKPFFIAVTQPLRLRASGVIRWRGQHPITPDGLSTSDNASAEERSHDSGRHPIVSHLPSQALIGRLCGVQDCGEPFLVGTDRTICPQPGFNNHLELWINHVVGSRGRLGSLPVTSDMFELQARHGEYRFEVSPATDEACGREAR